MNVNYLMFTVFLKEHWLTHENTSIAEPLRTHVFQTSLKLHIYIYIYICIYIYFLFICIRNFLSSRGRGGGGMIIEASNLYFMKRSSKSIELLLRDWYIMLYFSNRSLRVELEFMRRGSQPIELLLRDWYIMLYFSNWSLGVELEFFFEQIALAIIYYWRKPQGMDKYKRYQTPYTLR